MKTANETEQRFIILGSHRGLFKEPLSPRVSICHDRLEVEAAVSRPTHRVTWISFTRNFTDILLEKDVAAPAALRGSHLITLTPPRSESIQDDSDQTLGGSAEIGRYGDSLQPLEDRP
jgi:hypothetical protein